MKSKASLATLIFLFILTSCASNQIDPLDPSKGDQSAYQPQCPIGYKPVYSTNIVIKSTDEDKKAGDTTQEFTCEPER
ncbi:hypothetical protein OS175_08055 [Marinicella sp. S1101]|uniref:hypothetical protein n=1 Tax=Marinicella marina TaxID=2996016 RepID=UPI002260ADFC|nr:hypothetical protein [Marinicella marina]MCX7553828.1 hypothetical protein [Marinicella marina]MDJ1140904.1 hypothetical protein [Marinicella marina]